MKRIEQQEICFERLSRVKVGALFMEAGTGKTRVAVELVRSVPDIDLVVWFGPYRTINPGRALPSIVDEVKTWGGFRCKSKFIGVETISSSDKKYSEIEELLRSAKRPFIVVDESLKIKNVGAKRTRRILSLSKLAEYKLILNGTPITRNLLDLWAQMQFLSPKILDMTLQEYKDTFCRYLTITKETGNKKLRREIITGYENVNYLFSKVRNFVYSCDLHLNIKQNYSTIEYRVSEESRKKYNEVKAKYLNLEELMKWNNNIFLAMTSELQMSYMTDSEKINAVKRIFKDIPQEKTIIFCRFIESADVCRKKFPKATVLSYQKEAFGLNMQDYNYTIYFDKCWDLSLRVQSGRRTFRTGQLNDCYYYDLTANLGLDRLIDENIERKIGMSEYFKKVNIEEISKAL